jgi:hypothetical protein
MSAKVYPIGIALGLPLMSLIEVMEVVVGELGAPLRAVTLVNGVRNDYGIDPSTLRFYSPWKFVFLNNCADLRRLSMEADRQVFLISSEHSELDRYKIPIYPMGRLKAHDAAYLTANDDPLELHNPPPFDILKEALEASTRKSFMSLVNPLFYRVVSAERDRARSEFVAFMFGGPTPTGIPDILKRALDSPECAQLKTWAAHAVQNGLDNTLDVYPDADEFDIRYLIAKHSK